MIIVDEAGYRFLLLVSAQGIRKIERTRSGMYRFTYKNGGTKALYPDQMLPSTRNGVNYLQIERGGYLDVNETINAMQLDRESMRWHT